MRFRFATALLVALSALAVGCAQGAALDDVGAAPDAGPGAGDASADAVSPDAPEADGAGVLDAEAEALDDVSVEADAPPEASSDTGAATDAPVDVPAEVATEASDSCVGVTCASPPASYCSDAATRVVHDVPGSCALGVCSYAATHGEFCQFGCVNGACRACGADGDCPSGSRCDAGSCVACVSEAHCGATCAPCGALQVCTGGACVDAGCPPPAVSCTTGAENRDRCSGARVIGRKTAATTAGYSIASDTCSASNRFDVCNWDAGADHAYRLYMRASETTSITLTTGTGCVNSYWDATLHVFSNSGCADTSCPTEEFCADFFEGTRAYTAPRDGWYVIVVDGSTAFDDEGDYALTVKLACKVAGCECP